MRMRPGIVFVLLVLIMLVISALFGLLTYWLDEEIAPTFTPGPGGASARGGTRAMVKQGYPGETAFGSALRRLADRR